ncbi:hypothetical protein [Brevibacillus choshinensis]|uniref:Uncharacterized protein n=1 Tax=Brevibacillus choshinensis TaxID=54911 RepID=A0ABX7FIB1_BRECH|nr:hypothetical protein [Brevibacillus choshinensis]QRG65956.1 hypothetical protein JNE38_20575 [Brevibacillus choshinensis]
MNEKVYLNELINTYGYFVLQHYGSEELTGKKGGRLTYDIALLHTPYDRNPFMNYEILSFNNTSNTNQDNGRDHYMMKVIYARNKLQVPLAEIDPGNGKSVKDAIKTTIDNYLELTSIKDPLFLRKELDRLFYNEIFDRIGRYFFNLNGHTLDF